jgi:hypothetical protein
MRVVREELPEQKMSVGQPGDESSGVIQNGSESALRTSARIIESSCAENEAVKQSLPRPEEARQRRPELVEGRRTLRRL